MNTMMVIKSVTVRTGSLQKLALTPCSTVLLEKLINSSSAGMKFPVFYETRRFYAMHKKPATCPYPEPN
jgi:hypothetical protein